MKTRTWSKMLLASITGLLLTGSLAQADDDHLEAMKFAAHCKAEGDGAAKCIEAQRELVKYSLHCKVEGADAKRCQQAGEVVKAQKLAEQPGVTGAAPAAAKAAPAAAAAKSAAGKDEEEIKYALHCKAEGDDAKRCMGKRDELGKYAARCKVEGADGTRCQTAQKAAKILSGKQQ